MPGRAPAPRRGAGAPERVESPRNPPVADRERHHREQPVVDEHNHSSSAVDQNRPEHGCWQGGSLRAPSHSSAPRTVRERVGRVTPPSERSTTSGWRTATSASKLPSRAAAKKAATTWRCWAQVGVRCLEPRRGHGDEPGGELPCRIGRAADHRGDVVEGHVEHVMHHEGQPLGRRQGVEHDLEGQSHGVGQHRLLLGCRQPRALGRRVGAWSGRRGSSSRARVASSQTYRQHERDKTAYELQPPRFSIVPGGRAAQPVPPGLLDRVDRGLARRESPACGTRRRADRRDGPWSPAVSGSVAAGIGSHSLGIGITPD